jgi:cyclic pyranopterin phosphate synthase
MELTAHQNRTFKKLRVSITENCNLSCIYCDAQKENVRVFEKVDLLMLVDVVRKLHDQLDLASVRITGGEPTLNPELPNFVRGLKQLGIPEINLTTNGIFLKDLLSGLKEAGLDRVNISLDSVDEDIFSKITGYRGADLVIRSILTAKDAGFDVKINAIIMRGINENQVLPLLQFAMENQCKLRFLELMKMGHATDSHEERYYSRDEILLKIQSRYNFTEMPRELSSTTRYYQIIDNFSFGVIANHSEPFCEDCDRLRLDHKGNLYGCLSNPVYFPLAERSREDYSLILKNAMLLKQAKKFTGSALNMRHIGG